MQCFKRFFIDQFHNSRKTTKNLLGTNSTTVLAKLAVTIAFQPSDFVVIVLIYKRLLELQHMFWRFHCARDQNTRSVVLDLGLGVIRKGNLRFFTIISKHSEVVVLIKIFLNLEKILITAPHLYKWMRLKGLNIPPPRWILLQTVQDERLSIFTDICRNGWL